MVIRPLEIALCSEEIGLSFFSFLWDDGTWRSLLAAIYKPKEKGVVIGIAFFTLILEWE